ncbi:SHOCT domain-containing protein [Jatrophihabitans sp. DSM 45814]
MIRRGFGRVGRPGLLGTMARTAVIAGTATAVSGGVTRRQNERAATQQEAAAYEQQQQIAAAQQQMPTQNWQSTPPQSAAAQQPAGSDTILTQLTQLGDLKDRGLLTDAEFETQKARLLGT